ncbi:hypothetical protein FI667_g12599, partial [Globisporangium splendens]
MSPGFHHAARRPSDPPSSFLKTPGVDVDPSAIDCETILSADEIQVLRHRFASYSNHAPTASGKNKSLSRLQAIKLFRDDYPGLSEWEIQEMFQKCDLNFDGNLSIAEHLQASAYHRLVAEANTENEVFRSFTILDTDSDGIIVADDVLQLIDQSGLHAVGILKQAIVQAAVATKEAENPSHHHHHHRHHHHTQQNPRRHHNGEITFGHFARTTRMVNRKMEQEIATKSLRVLGLQEKLAHVDSQPPQRRVKEKQEALLIEIDVLQKEILRAKRELLTNANNPLGHICENLIATYENEQHVYECLSNFISYCSLRDATLFRYKLGKSGKEVHVLDSVLLAPPPHLKQTQEYARMMDLSLTSSTSSASQSPASTSRSDTTATARSSSHHHVVDHSSTLPPASHTAIDELLVMNPTLRKQFVHYAMTTNVTNLEAMTRSSFIKFVRNCEIDSLPATPLTEADLVNIFAKVCGASKSMTFHQWLAACQILFQQPGARCIAFTRHEAAEGAHLAVQADFLAFRDPESCGGECLVLVAGDAHAGTDRRSLFRQVDSKVTVDMKEFLCFARAFDIVRATAERDGEPYIPPPMSKSAVIQPISLMELVREFFAAKLDVSFANPSRRDVPGLNFREFLRCILRISLAMHAHNPKRSDKNRSNGVFTTSFEALKEEEGRSVQRVHTPLYRRRGNVLGSSPTKARKMISASIIAKLLRTSRALISQREESGRHAAPANPKCADLLIDIRLDPLLNAPSSSSSRSPVKIVYGQKTSSNQKQGFAIDSHAPPFSPVRPGAPHRARPKSVTSGGPPVIRLIQPPPES